MNRSRGVLLLGCALAACAQPERVAKLALPPLPEMMAECASLPPMDQAVIDCALTEFLDALQDASPIQADGTRPAPHIHVLPVIGPTPEIARRMAGIRPQDPPPIPASLVPEELRASLEQATRDASARARTGYAGFLSSDPRIRVPADSSWDTRSTTIGLSLPGYGFECDLAVVRFWIPAGLHSVQATSVLTRSPSGWEVIARKGGTRPKPARSGAAASGGQSPATSHTYWTALDEQVIDAVVRDLVTPRHGYQAIRWPEFPLVLRAADARAPSVDELMRRYRAADWEQFPEADLPSLQVAAEDLAERARSGFTGLVSSGPWPVRPVGDAAGRPPGAIELYVHAPGYGYDCDLAFVLVQRSWLLGSEDYKFVLERTTSGWKVLVREWIAHP